MLLNITAFMNSSMEVLKMRKIAILLALLIAALPFVLAHENELAGVDAEIGVNAKARIDSEDKGQANVEAKTKAEARTKVESKGVGFEIKQVTEEAKLGKARSELNLELKQKLKECESVKTKECVEARNEAKTAAKATLISASDSAALMVEKIKALVAQHKSENSVEVTAKLEAKAKAIAEARANAEKLGKDSSKDEVKAAALKLRTELEETKLIAKHETSVIMSNKLGGVLQKSEQLESKLDRILAKLSADGVDVSAISTTEFKAKLDSAASLKAEADALVEKSKTLEGKEKGQTLKEAAAKLRASHKAVKEAHAELKKIVAGIKQKQGGSAAVDASAKADAKTEVEE